MAYFVRIGPKILNLDAVLFAERVGDQLVLAMGRQGSEAQMALNGTDADRAESELLRYHEMNMEFLRRNRVISANQ